MIYLDITSLILWIDPKKKEMFYDGIPRSIVEFSLALINNENIKYICAGFHGYTEVDRKFINTLANTTVTPEFYKYSTLYKLYYSTTFNVDEILYRYKNRKIKAVYHVIKRYFSSMIARNAVSKGFTYVNMQNGDIIIAPCPITVLKTEQCIESARKKAKIKLAVLVHDIIPILHPSYLSFNIMVDVQSFFAKFYTKVDLYLTNSQNTEKDVRNFLASEYNILNPSTRVLKWGFSIAKSNANECTTPLIAGNYIMYVSTFGPRKNHITLLKAWQEVIASSSATGWKLICVGQKPDATQMLKINEYIQQNPLQQVEFLHNIGSEALINLYTHCKFTLYPSLYEGYGMPIAESVYYGKLCIASNTSSMPEVACEYADYIDPTNHEEIRDKILHYIINSAALKRREDEIKNAHITTWQEAANYMIDVVSQ